MLVILAFAAILGPCFALVVDVVGMPSPAWRRRVTYQAEARRSGQWRPAGRWVSTAGPNRVTPHASGTETARAV